MSHQMLILFLPLLSFLESLFLSWPQHENTGSSYTSLEAQSYRTKTKHCAGKEFLALLVHPGEKLYR